MQEFVENLQASIDTAPNAQVARFLRAALADVQSKQPMPFVPQQTVPAREDAK